MSHVHIFSHILTEYVEVLIKMVEAICCDLEYEDQAFPGVDVDQPARQRVPLNFNFDKPDKAAAVQAHVTRFL